MTQQGVRDSKNDKIYKELQRIFRCGVMFIHIVSLDQLQLYSEFDPHWPWDTSKLSLENRLLYFFRNKIRVTKNIRRIHHIEVI